MLPRNILPSLTAAASLLLLSVPEGVSAEQANAKEKVEFGVCFHHNEEYSPAAVKVLQDLRSAGEFWIRGDYEHPQKDLIFARDMQARGIKVLALLPWYKKGTTAGWKAYAEKEIRALPFVPAWEISNEPEMSWWGGPIPAKDYMVMLKDAHAVIKKVNPNALIIGPAVGCTAEGCNYLRTLVDAGLLDYVDAISVHYYIFHKNLEIDGIKKIVAGRKPIWITETGWTVADQQGAEAAQLKYVQDYYDRKKGKLASDPAIAVIFNYELNDDHYPLQKGKDDGWGLTYGAKSGFKKKQAYGAFKSLLSSRK